MPQAPALLFSLVLATLYAALFHLIVGRRVRDLVFYWLAAVVGFSVGQLVGMQLRLVPWTIGEVRIVEGTVIAILFLLLAHWLRQEKAGSSQGQEGKSSG